MFECKKDIFWFMVTFTCTTQSIRHLCGAIFGAKGNNLGPPDNESKWLCDNISHIHCITEEFFYAFFFHLVAQKLGFQTSGESTGNAELLSQFIVQGKQSRYSVKSNVYMHVQNHIIFWIFFVDSLLPRRRDIPVQFCITYS